MAQRDLLSAREANIHRVVIIGGGFGGLYATQCLKHEPVATTLIDRRNFHLFQPLLYQVATGWLSPANIAATLRAKAMIFRNEPTRHWRGVKWGLGQFHKLLQFR